LLREWITHQVVPTLRDERYSHKVERPTLSVLDWPKMSLCMLHWQDVPWIRLRDMPAVLVDDPFSQHESWWRKASRFLRGFLAFKQKPSSVFGRWLFVWDLELGLLRSPAGASSLATGVRS
jgi:prophage antirepressor-like protein